MTKIMLVEDDKSLREIYGVRLLAEGYTIVPAGDGEEALAMAIKERPNLIISDVMMPKISGFDLLDILRSTTETKNIRVIMMTALSSEDQRLRGEQLGADRYLVKSQVGIEDVVRVVHEVLEDAPRPAAQQAARPQAQTTAPAGFTVPPRPVARPATPLAPPPTGLTPPPAAPVVVGSPLPVPSVAPPPVKPPQSRSKVISPINDPTTAVNINDLLDREIAKEAGLTGTFTPVQTTSQEQFAVNTQISQFQSSALPQPMSPDDIPTIAINPQGAIKSEPTQLPTVAPAPVADPTATVAPAAAPASPLPQPAAPAPAPSTPPSA